MTHSDLQQHRLARALPSEGGSEETLLRRVQDLVHEKSIHGNVIVDLGCGRGDLWPYLTSNFQSYIGVDLVRYDGFPTEQRFIEMDLDGQQVPLESGCADLVVSIETIEHLENPRSFIREIVRILAPRGWLILTTPNQTSLLSKLSLILKDQFVAFQERPGLYPSHITALLPMDLHRLAREQELENIEIRYSQRGRVPSTARHYPAGLSRALPRALSDNVVLIARKAAMKK